MGFFFAFIIIAEIWGKAALAQYIFVSLIDSIATALVFMLLLYMINGVLEWAFRSSPLRRTTVLYKDPDAIIQVSVPLLIELNLQFLFDKLLLVYVRPQIQAERLAVRDGITVAEAENIMKSQLPIDEKAGYADFVIHNEGSLAETKEKVQAVWDALQKARKE